MAPGHAATDVNVAAGKFDLRVNKLSGELHLGETIAAQWRRRTPTANQFCSDEGMNFVNLIRVEEAAEKLAAPFDQHVRQPPAAELV
jgi:hypothetical protein